jgi:hypothetical protein
VDANKYVRCENGHQYDPKKDKNCPYCPQAETAPKRAEANRQTPEVNAPKSTAVDGGDGASQTRGTPSNETQPGATPQGGHSGAACDDMQNSAGEGTVVENSGSANPPKTEAQRSAPLPTDPSQKQRKRSGTLVLPNPDAPKQLPIFGWLVITEGTRQYEVIRISQEQSYVGTDAKCDIIIEDNFVSSEHASIRYREKKFFITDLDSKNGTFVNNFGPDTSIDREELKDGDEIHIGQTVMIFKCL